MCVEDDRRKSYWETSRKRPFLPKRMSLPLFACNSIKMGNSDGKSVKKKRKRRRSRENSPTRLEEEQLFRQVIKVSSGDSNYAIHKHEIGRPTSVPWRHTGSLGYCSWLNHKKTKIPLKVLELISSENPDVNGRSKLWHQFKEKREKTCRLLNIVSGMFRPVCFPRLISRGNENNGKSVKDIWRST